MGPLGGHEDDPAAGKGRGDMSVKPRACPACGGQRVLIVLRDGRTGLCYECGSRWTETRRGQTTIMSIPGERRVVAPSMREPPART